MTAAETIARARELAAELAAGHPAYQETPRDELLPWQREQAALWALNLTSVLAGYVPALLAELDAREEQRSDIESAATELLDAIAAEQPDFDWTADLTADAIDRLTKLVLPSPRPEATG